MINIVSGKNICLVGKADDVFRRIKYLSLKYGTLKEAIDDLQLKQQRIYPRHPMK
ncbi:hypothetical protein [Sporosalibacterium faouarense]|uniref:hypothetical protein n=1 Tax=Sporosalibacterium faouarense TaxID=516123 RepID=UPI00192CA39B|nr:hypothetical protein [Sporosalibacterium faouarense]